MKSNLYSTNFSQFCYYGNAVLLKIVEKGELYLDDDIPEGIINELEYHQFITFNDKKPCLTGYGKQVVALGGLGNYYINKTSYKKPWWVRVLTWKPRFIRFIK